MSDVLYRVFKTTHKSPAQNVDDLLSREWIITNGLGGYASSTLGSLNTWRYHGLLVSAEAPPLGRMAMLSHLVERIRFADGRVITISGTESVEGELDLPATKYLSEFRLEYGLPVWRYNVDGYEFERGMVMPHEQNTVYIRYHALSSDEITLELAPQIWFRPFEASYEDTTVQQDYNFSANGKRYEITSDRRLPPLRMSIQGDDTSFTSHGGGHQPAFFRRDKSRGTDSRGLFWSPGFFSVKLSMGQETAFIASTEPWSSIEAIKPEEAVNFEQKRRVHLLSRALPQAQTGAAAELVLAADQFLIAPVGRMREEIMAAATNDSVRAIFAGYHWFTDWGRDTLISLEGLTLVTGRTQEAGWILRTMARYVRNGLVPNFIPDGAQEGLYHTADATLWFFHALDRYLAYTNDTATLELLLPQLVGIAEQHIKGTLYNIKVDPVDSLLSQGQEGYQLTWMDAKVGDWVVTPRRGKAVEINSLWYNALRLLQKWTGDQKGPEAAQPWKDQADRLQQSFNKRFWYEKGGHLYDVIDCEKGGDDPSLRPNQLFSFSLSYPVLDRKYWQPVMDKVKANLLTPVGIRTLAPFEPDYKPRYDGDLKVRDAAYHQGTVWPWLVGPFIDAWLAINPDDKEGARHFLDGMGPRLESNGLGTISEIADAEAPYTPRGCISQAWSVAEFLRCWVKTAS